MLEKLFQSVAYAQQTSSAAPAPAQAAPSFVEGALIPILLIIGVLYLLIIRPQSKRNKEQANMLATLKVGDEVITNSGIIGKVKSIADQFVVLEIGPSSTMKIVKQYIVGLTKPLNSSTASTSSASTTK